MHPLKLAASNTIWSLSGRATVMGIKFFSVPLLLNHYGKDNYGLIVLAISLSAYMSIASLALPTGIIRHAAGWLATGNLDNLKKASRSSITFYGFLGLLNCLVFILIAAYGLHWFKIPTEKIHDFQFMLYVAGFATLVTWPFSLLEQLLSGAEELAWLAKVNMTQEVIGFLILITAIWAALPITDYFLIYVLVPFISISLNVFRWKKYVPILNTIKPGWFWNEFKEVLSFGLGLFVIGLSMSLALQLRPIILGMRAVDGVGSVAEYQILNGVSGIVTIFYGVISSALLPLASKAIATNDENLVKTIIYTTTKYIWSFLAFILFGMIMISDHLLTIYVGTQYSGLSLWLNIWILAFLMLYLTPIAALVMGTGKIKMLIFSCPIGAIISIALLWLLSPKLNVGASAVSTVAYYLFSFMTYHVYYLPKVLKISPIEMLRKYFIPPVVGGIIMIILGRTMGTLFTINNPYLWLIIVATTGCFVYILFTLFFFISPHDFINIFRKFKAPN
jgi:O-antigen/teichoic acid export membrane protein